MSTAEYAKRYQTLAANTAPPGHLVLMLFDGALRFMDLAVAGFVEEERPDRMAVIHTNLIKAQKILSELQTTLDLEKGGEFAARMFALYDYLIGQLRDATFKKDPEPVKVAGHLLAQIREVWAQMLTQSSDVAA